MFQSFEITYIPPEPVVVGEREESVQVYDLNGSITPKKVAVTTEFLPS